MGRITPPPPAWPQVGPDDEGLISWATANGITKPTVGAGLARQSALNSTNGFVTLLLGRVPLVSALESDSAAVNNSETMVDTGLQVTLVTDTTYLLSGWVPYFSDTTADIKFQWAGTATVGGFYAMNGPGTAGAGSESTIKNLTVGMGVVTTLGGGGAGRCSAHPAGRVHCTSGGTFKLQFAQNVATVADTTIETDAWIRLEPDGT